MKLEKPADAVALLEPATKLEGGAGRANLGLALAHFATGAEAPARKALDARSRPTPHYGKTLLGRIRRRVENVAGAQPGSVEEALLYAQTYGDVWTDAAKKFLEKVARRAGRGDDQDEKAAAPAADEDDASAPRLASASASLTYFLASGAELGRLLGRFSSASQSSIFLLRLSSSGVLLVERLLVAAERRGQRVRDSRWQRVQHDVVVGDDVRVPALRIDRRHLLAGGVDRLLLLDPDLLDVFLASSPCRRRRAHFLIDANTCWWSGSFVLS